MKILKYTADIQNHIKSNVKAEPWLHIGFYIMRGDKVYYAIWIWDTREIVGNGELNYIDFNGSNAIDNHKPLKGKNAEQVNIFMPKSKNNAEGLHVDNAEHFKELIRQYKGKYPANVKAGLKTFIKGMDNKYGKGRHPYHLPPPNLPDFAYNI